MKYLIPTTKLEKLGKIIKKYQKKGAVITFQVGNKVIEQGTLYVNNPMTHTQVTMPIDVECYEVFVEGTYIISGWQFVGTIDFTENGNIIRLANSAYEGLVPAKYLHTPKICEHCGKIRNRKDTYLIMSDEGEWKQVGSSCLLDYTHGLDADKCASIMSCLDQVKTLSNKDYDLDSFKGNGFSSTGMSLGNASAIKALAIGLVKAHGYTRMDTADDLANLFFHNLPSDIEDQLFSDVTAASDEEVKALDDYAQLYLNSDNDYMRNASLAWSKKSLEFRDFGLISSFANTYLKEMAKIAREAQKKAQINNEYVGNIGERITVVISSFRLLYESSTQVAWHTYAHSYTYEIIDNEGHVFIWKSSKMIDRKVVDDKFVPVTPVSVVATIKEHSEYKGIKQTKITNGRINY